MAVLPTGMMINRRRQQQPGMNYATGTPTDTGQPPAQPGAAAPMNYGYGNYGRTPSVPGLQQQPMRGYAGMQPGAMMPAAGNGGGPAIASLQARVNPNMGGMAGITPLYAQVGGQGMRPGGGYNLTPMNSNMLTVLRRRGILPTGF